MFNRAKGQARGKKKKVFQGKASYEILRDEARTIFWRRGVAKVCYGCAFARVSAYPMLGRTVVRRGLAAASVSMRASQVGQQGQLPGVLSIDFSKKILTQNSNAQTKPEQTQKFVCAFLLARAC